MTKGRTLQGLWDGLPADRQQRIEARADELSEEYRTLQELRKAAGITQARVSKKMDMPQSNISRLEKNSDMLLSTLQSYISAIGGKLNLTVELPDKPTLTLTGLGDLIDSKPKARSKSRAVRTCS